MGKVRVIPSTINPLTHQSVESCERRKVAAYARVSTDSDEQYTSYEAQVNYYTKYIQSRIDWEYVNVYADEGISGTNTKKRVQFNKMIEDALSGKINLIVTKSISRFARNTLDTISYIRNLRAAGVEVFFEKENLWTFDSKSEMVLSMLAAIAQEESRSISENVKIGKRWGFKEGRVSMPYKSFLGYEKVDGKVVINEEQAETVRLIYRLYLRDGLSRTSIADYLNKKEIKTPGGHIGKWTPNNITSILTNEKYKGDALLQKSYVENYLDHAVKKNDGALPQYYVENNHPEIISKEEWNEVQSEMKNRNESRYAYSKKNPFCSRLICSCCGAAYGSKVWHSTDIYKKEIFQCTRKYAKGKDKCDTPNLTEEDVKSRFVEAYNKLMADKDSIISSTSAVIDMLTDTSKLDEKIKKLTDELNDIRVLVENLIKDNSSRSQNQAEYSEKYDSLNEKYNSTKEKLDKELEEKESMVEKADALRRFLKNLSERPTLIETYDPILWNVMLEKAIVNKDGTITFKFKGGKEITL